MSDPDMLKTLAAQRRGTAQSKQQKSRQPQHRPPPKPVVRKEEKRVRVLSAPENEKHKRPVRLHERPRWGGKPVKKLVKNSEKDPHYEHRHKAIEEQRERRQMQLLEESAKYSTSVPRGRSK